MRSKVMTYKEFEAREPKPQYPECRNCGKPVEDLTDTHCSTRCLILDMDNLKFEIEDPYGQISEI